MSNVPTDKVIMTKEQLKIERVDKDEEIPFDLLELADPSSKQIKDYLDCGHCYVARLAYQTIGAIVLKEITPNTVEIKNIAVDESFQRKGYGKVLLRYAEKLSRESNYEKIIIGTGNSSVGQLALYQEEGFEISHIEKNFFIENYEEPIFENGIQCKHLIVLEKKLEKNLL